MIVRCKIFSCLRGIPIPCIACKTSIIALLSRVTHGLQVRASWGAQGNSSVTFTSLTPRWYIKRAMRKIASFLAMTVESGAYRYFHRHCLIVRLKIS